MSIFSRFADIINSNMNALLDKAEDPQKLIRMIIQEMEDTLVEVRTISAKTLADRKELVRKADWLESEIGEWQRKAELALTKDREDLAKAALAEKHKMEFEFQALSKEVKQLDESLKSLSDEISQLQEKLKDAKVKQQSLTMRFSTQSSRLKVNKRLYEQESGTAVEKFERFQRKLDDIEAEVESYQLGRNSQLKAEFEELEASDKVSDELQELKRKMEQEGRQ